MPELIKNRRLCEDRWQRLEDEAPLPPRGAVLVSWARWQRERAQLLARAQELGVRVNGDVEPEALGADAHHFAVIALEFPQFKDGRCYSHARLLRERYGYRGELRAVGEILRDQIFYMHRVGIDAFELSRGKDAAEALRAFEDFSVSYQAAADQRQPIWRRRRAPAPRAVAQAV